MNTHRSKLVMGLFALVLCGSLVTVPAWANRAESDKYVTEARRQLEKGDVRAAIVQLKNAVRADDGNLEARRLLGSAQASMGDWLSAEKELGIVVEKATDDSNAILGYGESLLQLRRYDDLLARVVPKGRAKEVEAQVYAIRGYALMAVNRADDASNAFAESIKLVPTARAHLGMAAMHLRARNAAAAEAEVDQALQIDPKSGEALLAKAELRRDAGANEEALGFTDKAVAIPRVEMTARLTRAGILLRMNQDGKAATDVDAVLARAKDQPLATYYKALIASKANNLDAAQQLLQGLSPEFVDGYLPAMFLSGAVAYGKGQLDTAEARLRTYVNRQPNAPAVRKILGTIYLRKGDPTKAMAVLEPALQLAPNDVQLLGLLGTAAERLGKLDQAVSYFERASQQAPDNQSIQTQLALGKLRSGQSEEGIQALENIVDKDPNAVRATSALLAAYLRQGDFDKALGEVADLRKKTPNSAMPDYYEGAILVARRENAAGRKMFEAALAKDPKFQAANFALARLDATEGNRQAAMSKIAKLLADDPGNQRAVLSMAELQIAEGKVDDAIKTLDDARRADAKSVPVRLRLVDAYLAKKEGERALVVAREATNLTGGSPETLDALGRVQTALGDKASAIGTYRQIVAQMPQSGAALQRLAGALLLNNDSAGAKQALLQAARVDPAFAPAQQDYVRLAARDGGPDAAVAAARELRENAPKSTMAPILLGDSYMLAKKYGDAAATFRQARTANPSLQLLVREAEALRADKKDAQAKGLLEGWVKDNPEDPAGRFSLATYYLETKDEKAAITEYDKVLVKAPNNVPALNNLAWLIRDRDPARALSLAQRAVELAPNASEVLDTYGWLLVKQNQAEKAIEPLRKATSVQAPQPATRYHLAAALAATGKSDEAKMLLDAILQPNVTFDERADAEALRKKLGN